MFILNLNSSYCVILYKLLPKIEETFRALLGAFSKREMYIKIEFRMMIRLYYLFPLQLDQIIESYLCGCLKALSSGKVAKEGGLKLS